MTAAKQTPLIRGNSPLARKTRRRSARILRNVVDEFCGSCVCGGGDVEDARCRIERIDSCDNTVCPLFVVRLIVPEDIP